MKAAVMPAKGMTAAFSDAFSEIYAGDIMSMKGLELSKL